MHFDLTDDQHEIKRTARDLLARRSGAGRVREVAESGMADAALRAEVGELGWLGIAIDPDYGGLGLGSVEAAVVLEELGYALAGAPVLASTAAAFVLSEAGSEAQRTEWLPRIADGTATAALGAPPSLVPNALEADLFVLVEDGRARLLPATDAVVEPRGTIDPTRTYGRVSGDGALLPGDPQPALQRASIAVASELVGVCQRALDVTVAYVKDRHQFDRPIGSFQAVAHRCTDMLIATESVRSAAYYGAWCADADPDGLQFAAALAKSVAASAAVETTASAIQAHGGIGFTWEADVHWLYKRAQLDAQFLGGTRVHRAALARLLPGRRRAR